MRVVFRADASLEIGNGHVIRCLTLAEILKKQGASCSFICQNYKGHLNFEIRKRGFEVHEITSVNENPKISNALQNNTKFDITENSSTKEIAHIKKILRGEPIDWIIVDHYSLDHRWERKIRSITKKIMVIDDMANRRHDCDILIDQNLGRKASDYDGLVTDNCMTLIGPEYALLRPEFALLRENSLVRRRESMLRKIMISMGGVDAQNGTEKVLRAIQRSKLSNKCEITIVMGPNAPWLERVKKVCAEMAQIIDVRRGVENMAKLMVDSDLAIGTSGITSWERCCLGLPSLIEIHADNQKLIAESLHAVGAAKLIDTRHGFDALNYEINQFLESPIKLEKMSKRAYSITDGNGANRVLEKMSNHQ